MANRFRKMVSLKKRRFTQDGFDLDLACTRTTTTEAQWLIGIDQWVFNT
jgi:hypothetical protein